MLQQIAPYNIFHTGYITLCIRPTTAIFQWQPRVPGDNLHWTSKRWCWRRFRCGIRDPPLQSGHPKWHRELEKCQLPDWMGRWGTNPQRGDKMRGSTWTNKWKVLPRTGTYLPATRWEIHHRSVGKRGNLMTLHTLNLNLKVQCLESYTILTLAWKCYAWWDESLTKFWLNTS